MGTLHPMTEWCEGCKRRVDGRCTVYEDPLRKTWNLGCNFSPKVQRALDEAAAEKKARLGQQKGARGKKQRA